jgi:glucose-1-phosphate thymidylyltransferase
MGKGILLAGGTGSRLWPTTLAVNKHLLPVYDKPLLYFPLATLMLAHIREVLVITSPRHLAQIRNLLGDGTQWGMSISVGVQDEPKGIAHALVIARDFLGDAPCALALGDNIFHGANLGESLKGRLSVSSATIFSYQVRDASPYACLEIDEAGRATGIAEKPVIPPSTLAVPGLYFYPPGVSRIAEGLTPSSRGELEITDVNRHYLKSGSLEVVALPRGTAWLDAGTSESLLDSANYVKVLQERQGGLIGAPDEVALRNGWIDSRELERLLGNAPDTSYSRALRRLVG